MSSSTDGTGAARQDPGLAGYLEAMDTGDAPLLGHLVLYSIFDGQVTHRHLVDWFAELGLDARRVPGSTRPVDAYEKVTGPSGPRMTYPLDDPASAGQRRRRPAAAQRGRGQSATLMVRPVRRDGAEIVRHLVREVRDEAATALSYDTRLAECVFARDNDTDEHGAGTLQITPDHAAIAALPAAEQDQVRALLTEIRSAYARQCAYLSADRLRALVRGYIESLRAVRVRPTGGVYFVPRQHAGVLGALRELVSRFGGRSHLTRIPIPDQDEMREMVIAAFTTKARDDLDRLARDIASARHDGASDTTLEQLHQRFTELKAATSEHSQLLHTSLDDTTAALHLVQAQLATLLAQAS
jgi:hypothetical protein